MTTDLLSRSLLLAASLSIGLHLAAMLSWPSARPPLPRAEIRLEVRLKPAHPAPPAAPAPRTSPGTPARHAAPHAGTRTGPVPPALARPGPENEATPPRPDPPIVFAADALTQAPALLTEISPEDWPPTPGSPSGRFGIDVDIGTDGSVMRVNPICDSGMCDAAATYAGVIIGWRFAPAEILGHPVASRIRVEFEIGSPASQGFIATPTNASSSPAPVVRPSEASP